MKNEKKKKKKKRSTVKKIKNQFLEVKKHPEFPLWHFFLISYVHLGFLLHHMLLIVFCIIVMSCLLL